MGQYLRLIELVSKQYMENNWSTIMSTEPCKDTNRFAKSLIKFVRKIFDLLSVDERASIQITCFSGTEK